jgi:hypothetical protein
VTLLVIRQPSLDVESVPVPALDPA